MAKNKSGYFYIFVCTLIFSTVEVVLKFVAGIFAPLQITFLRFSLGGLMLLPFALRALRERNIHLGLSDFKKFAFTGFLFIPVTMTFYQLSVTFTEASVVAVIFSSNALFVTLFASVVLGEKLRYNHFIALGFEVLAIFLIIDPFGGELDPTGALLAALSAILFATYSICGKKLAPRYGGVAVSCFSILCGSLELFALILLGRTALGASLFSSLGLTVFVDVPLVSNIPLSALPWLLLIAFINTGGGFVTHMLAMEKNTAREAALIFFFKPMIAPLFALIFLGENITHHIPGIVCFLIGAGFSMIPGLLEERRKLKQ